MYTSSASAKSENAQPSVPCSLPKDLQAKYAPMAKAVRWIARKPMGGIWLTKSPMGMAWAPFEVRRRAPARELAASAVDDDARQGEGHPEHHHQVGGVLGGAESGMDVLVRVDRQGEVDDQVECHARHDHADAEEAEQWRPAHRPNRLGNWSMMPLARVSARSRIWVRTSSYAAISAV